MLISRRSTLVSVSAIAATSLGPIPALALTPGLGSSNSQFVEHLLIHADEAGGQPHCAPIAIAADDTAWVPVGNLEEAAHLAAAQNYGSRGYGLRRVNAFQTQRGVRYAAIWQLGGPAPFVVRHDLTLAEFQHAADSFSNQGLALAHVDGSATPSGARFAAIWVKSGAPAQKIYAGLTAGAFEDRQAALAQGGYRIRQIAGYAPDGEARFAAVFEKDSGASHQAAYAIAAPQFNARNRAMAAQGYKLRDASGYVAGGQPTYTAVWDKA